MKEIGPERLHSPGPFAIPVEGERHEAAYRRIGSSLMPIPQSNVRYTQKQRDNDRSAAIRALVGDAHVVYAMRLLDRTIKIGSTARLWHRRCEVARGAEIIGFRFGELEDEQAIHALLVDHRHHGHEYYHPTADVMAVVNSMRDEWNLPHIAA